MMKYLAFGLVTALLLDATVVRMFLVPSVMKLLRDECWWAPQWMKRLQNRMGLSEIDLPDERKPRAVLEQDLEIAAVATGPSPDAAPDGNGESDATTENRKNGDSGATTAIPILQQQDSDAS
jgi:RND superfamily putative drug exporter